MRRRFTDKWTINISTNDSNTTYESNLCFSNPRIIDALSHSPIRFPQTLAGYLCANLMLKSAGGCTQDAMACRLLGRLADNTAASSAWRFISNININSVSLSLFKLNTTRWIFSTRRFTSRYVLVEVIVSFYLFKVCKECIKGKVV